LTSASASVLLDPDAAVGRGLTVFDAGERRVWELAFGRGGSEGRCGVESTG
jgi:hypothetical protein